MTLFLAVLMVCAQEEALIKKLGSDVIEEREKAARKLEALGQGAVPALTKAAASDDGEISGRAAYLLRLIRINGLVEGPVREDNPGLAARLALDDDRIWSHDFLKPSVQ